MVAARRFVGGGSADYVVDADGNPIPSAVVNFYSAESAGTHYTDLLDHSGDGADHIVATAKGRVLRLQTPPGVDFMWADAGDGTRTLMVANDAPTVMRLAQLIIQALPGQTEQLEQLFDEFGNPIDGTPPAGGFYVSGDDIGILPPGDVFNRIIRLINTGGMFMAGGDMAGGVGVFGMGDRTTDPSGVPDGSHLYQGGTSRQGTIFWSANGRPHFKPVSGAVNELGLPTQRRHMEIYKNAGAATVTGVGMPAPTITVSGSAANADDATISPLVTLPTDATTGHTAKLVPATSGQVQAGWAPMLWERIVTDPAVTFLRYWFGFFSADPSATATAAALHAAAFRYDTAQDGTVFWRCVTNNAGTPTVTTTTVAVAAATKYDLRVEWNAANTAVRFLINGVLVATHTTTLPTFNQLMDPWSTCTALSNAARSFKFAKAVIEHVG